MKADGDLRFVQLGGRGIRDLVKVDDGFLVLGGPTGDSDQSELLYWWDGRDCVPGRGAPECVVTTLGRLPRLDGGRAEGMAVVDRTGDAWDMLFVFDGVAGGDPGIYLVRRPAR